MKLDSSRPDCGTRLAWHNLDWSSKSDLKSLQDFQPNSWVKLSELPNPYSFDEALLLCQVSRDEWLTWIPDHGEAQLHISQFFAN
ncbi:hypothetical protein [Scytonema sp. PRP1]|uniref:hypothetical protein n=1 Tax=Scytonema sp. PRP1 TaxID=3120513 RepID=UPI002FD36ADA